MTAAAKLYTKTERETKSVTIDCAQVMEPGETIDTVGAAVIAPDDGPVVSGLVTNDSVLTKPGERSIAIGEGLRFFLQGGTAGTVYSITIPYTTSEGQDLDATVKVKVVND